MVLISGTPRSHGLVLEHEWTDVVARLSIVRVVTAVAVWELRSETQGRLASNTNAKTNRLDLFHTVLDFQQRQYATLSFFSIAALISDFEMISAILFLDLQ